MQSQTKNEMFAVLEKYHKILQNENMKAAPDKSHLFLTRVKFLGHIIEKNTITLLKSRIDANQKLQPPTNKKKIQEFFGILNFWSKYVYKMQSYLRPFYNILRQQNNFGWTTEHQTRFEEIKKISYRTNLKHNARPQSTLLCNVRCFKFWHRYSITTISQWNK